MLKYKGVYVILMIVKGVGEKLENQKNNGGLIALVIVLCLLVLGLGGYIIYDKFISLEDNQVENNNTNDVGNNNLDEKVYTMSSVYGLYEHEVGTYGDGNKTYARIYLDENGTFMYWLPYPTPVGYAGNYYIENNKVVLNILFQTSGGMLFYPYSDGQITEQGIDQNHTLTVDESGNLSEVTPISKNSELISSYTKQNNETTKSFVESMGSLVKWLNDGYYHNNQNK